MATGQPYPFWCDGRRVNFGLKIDTKYLRRQDKHHTSLLDCVYVRPHLLYNAGRSINHLARRVGCRCCSATAIYPHHIHVKFLYTFQSRTLLFSLQHGIFNVQLCSSRSFSFFLVPPTIPPSGPSLIYLRFSPMLWRPNENKTSETNCHRRLNAHESYENIFFLFSLSLRRRTETSDVLAIQIARGDRVFLAVGPLPHAERLLESRMAVYTIAHLLSSGIIRGAGDAALACFYVFGRERRVGGGNGRNFPLRSLAGSFHTCPPGSASIVAAAFSFFFFAANLVSTSAPYIKTGSALGSNITSTADTLRDITT